MKQFKYEAKKGASLVKGILTALNKGEAIDKINEMGLVPVELVEEGSGRGHNLLVETGNPRESRVSGRPLIVFYRQIGRLIKSGVPLLPALVVATEQAASASLRLVLENIKEAVRHGKSLSASFLQYPHVFDPFSVAIVELGENTGRLDEALLRLAEYQERRHLIVNKVRNALLYPVLVIVLGAGALVFLLTYVIPKFSQLFEEMGQNLPFLTRALMDMSRWVRTSGLWLVLFAGVGMLVLQTQIRSPAVRTRLDQFKLKLPFLGKLIFMGQFAGFARSMEMLLKGGVPFLRALKIAVPVVSNRFLQTVLGQAVTKVEQGRAFSESMRYSNDFPKFATHLVLIGEQTGHLDQSFRDIADWYEQEVEEQTRIMIQLIEPVTILVIGLLLGLMAIAVLLPVFSMDAVVS